MSAQQADAGRWRDLGVRLASAAVLIPLVLVDVWLGAWWFAGLVGLLGLLAAREYARMVRPADGLFLASLLIAVLLAAGVMPLLGLGIVFFLLVLLAMATGVYLMRQGERDGFAYLAVIYIGLPLIGLMHLRFTEAAGAIAIYWLFAVVWGADTLAYFAGRLIGGPKLWPAISPKKTWAGLGGAIIGAMLTGSLVMWFAGREVMLGLILAAGGLAVIEQGGDFYESALKRRAGRKDSGNLIPGHGGILDRVDGLLFAAIGALALFGFGVVSW